MFDHTLSQAKPPNIQMCYSDHTNVTHQIEPEASNIPLILKPFV